MIPSFPVFAPIDPTNRPAIRDFAARFEPYSEYNATNMWCWHGKYREVSALNGNLVLKFRDAETAALHFSFIGTTAVEETAVTLLSAAGDQGVQPRLRLVPEVVVASAPRLGSALALGTEDHDADYVLSIAEWTALDGSDYKRARYNVADFGRRYRADFRPLDLAVDTTRREMRGLFRRWAEQKGAADAVATRVELAAFERLLALAPHPHLQGYGLVGDDGLLAFLVCERVGGGRVTLHFWKADRSYRGVYMTSLHHCCRVLLADGQRTLNIGQDLGDAGMAAAKQSFRPCAVLRKYTLGPRAA